MTAERQFYVTLTRWVFSASCFFIFFRFCYPEAVARAALYSEMSVARVMNLFRRLGLIIPWSDL